MKSIFVFNSFTVAFSLIFSFSALMTSSTNASRIIKLHSMRMCFIIFGEVGLKLLSKAWLPRSPNIASIFAMSDPPSPNWSDIRVARKLTSEFKNAIHPTFESELLLFMLLSIFFFPILIFSWRFPSFFVFCANWP